MTEKTITTIRSYLHTALAHEDWATAQSCLENVATEAVEAIQGRRVEDIHLLGRLLREGQDLIAEKGDSSTGMGWDGRAMAERFVGAMTVLAVALRYRQPDDTAVPRLDLRSRHHPKP